jgi:hypothetical protein
LSNKRKAILLYTSENGRKAVYVDEKNSSEILAWINASPQNKRKFQFIIELLLNGRITKELYDKENIEKGCENVTAMKPFRGTKNPRIYCQQYSDKNKKIFVIVASELLEKKKSNELTKKEKTIIRRVSKYDYELIDN